MDAGDLAVKRHDNEGALREYGATEALASENAEMICWQAVSLVNMERVDEVPPLFRRVFAMDPNWATLTPRLPRAGSLPENPRVMARILSASGAEGRRTHAR